MCVSRVLTWSDAWKPVSWVSPAKIFLGLQGLANILWGFAKLRYFSPRLQGALLDDVVARADELNCRDLLDVLWSLARMPDRTDTSLVELLTERLSKYLTPGKPGQGQESRGATWHACIPVHSIRTAVML
jgi:hypothetical protein